MSSKKYALVCLPADILDQALRIEDSKIFVLKGDKEEKRC